MKRWALNILAGLSLLLCLTTFITWMISLAIGCIAAHPIGLITTSNHIAFEWRDSGEVDWTRYVDEHSILARLGIHHEIGGQAGSPASYHLWLIPFWLPLLATALLPAWRLIQELRFSSIQRRAADHCPNCNYNLTANVNGTCPECGTCIASSPK